MPSKKLLGLCLYLFEWMSIDCHKLWIHLSSARRNTASTMHLDNLIMSKALNNNQI